MNLTREHEGMVQEIPKNGNTGIPSSKETDINLNLSRQQEINLHWNVMRCSSPSSLLYQYHQEALNYLIGASSTSALIFSWEEHQKTCSNIDTVCSIE